MRGKYKLKKFGWTMAELLVSLAVLVLLAAFCVFGQKPGMNKSELFVYFAVRSLTKANIAIMGKTFEIDDRHIKYNIGLGYDPKGITGGKFDVDGAGNDWYCSQVADVLSLSGTPNCKRTAAATDINIKFSNGITVQGLASQWIKPTADTPYEYKNIVIDIDGPDSGPNKPWSDRFPMRVYRGSDENKMEGIIMPVNCTVSGASTYCKQGKTYTGAVVARDFSIDDQVMTYDIYKMTVSEDDTISEENKKSTLVGSGFSAFEADCAAHHGKGFYSESECNTAGISLNPNCSGENVGCYTVLHRPSDGIPIFIQALVGEIDEDSI